MTQFPRKVYRKVEEAGHFSRRCPPLWESPGAGRTLVSRRLRVGVSRAVGYKPALARPVSRLY